MKNVITLRVGEPAGTPLQFQSKPAISSLPVIRTIIATFVILTHYMILDGESQTLHPPGHGSQVALSQSSSLSLRVAQFRQHPSYQVFAGGLVLPSTTVLDQATLDVGGRMKMDVSRLDQLSTQQKEALAEWYGVPAGVVDKFQESFAQEPSSDATLVAAKLRVTVIDYKYLLEFWTKYRPPAGKDQVRSDALLALQAGDIDKAWGMFADLPRPKPPTKVRKVVQN